MRLTKRIVDIQPSSEKDNYIWDSDLPGFGLKTTPAGRKVYLMQYRMGGRKSRTRRVTIGVHGKLTTEEARVLAKKKFGNVAAGRDPASERDKIKADCTVGFLIKKFETEYVRAKLKPNSIEQYQSAFKLHILPTFKNKLVSEIAHQEVVKLHNSLSSTPYFANRTLAILSKFFNWCEKYGYRPLNSNPCKHAERFVEKKRQRFLSFGEQNRLGSALNKAEAENMATPYAIAAFRLLSLTGARLSEIQKLKWEFVNWERGTLELPDSKTGAKSIYLNAAAIDVLSNIDRQKDNPFVICGLHAGEHVVNLQKPWRRIRALAELDDVRIHDLRHTFASVAVMGGMSLPMIGALLGHTQPQTTARYAHLAADPMKEASERIGQQISNQLINPNG